MKSFKDEWLVTPLLNKRVITRDTVNEIRYSGYNDSPDYISEKLLTLGYLNERQLGEIMEELFNIPFVDLNNVSVNDQIKDIIPEDVCRNNQVFAYQIDDEFMTVAFFDPMNLDVENELAHLSSRMIRTTLSTRSQILEKINAYYNPNNYIDGLADQISVNSQSGIDTDDANLNSHMIDGSSSDAPIVRLVNSVLNDAIDNEASDIHIEPGEHQITIRFRVDGILKKIMEVPKYAGPQITSRIKILSKLDIAESRKPQDGKAKVRKNNANIDLRVSVLPTSFGEKIVIRILDSRKSKIEFEKLGITGSNLQKLKNILTLRQGIILASGPTGSGKTTSLYSALNFIKSPETNILTVEDPIEYMIEGINQVQVNLKAGVTFASALRSFLRQDPDVILVGEIRDSETAEISIQAAMTGHLVLSTVHANNAFETVTRLVDMGVDRYKVGSAVSAVMAQRLVRKVCSSCAEEHEADPMEKHYIPLLEKHQLPTKFFKGRGCPQCDFTGFKGRAGIYEILVITKELRDLFVRNAPLAEIEKAAFESGFKSFTRSALEMISSGLTTVAEVSRVVNLSENEPYISEYHTYPESVDEKPKPEPVVKQNTQFVPAQKLKVMVVEDDPIVQKIVTRVLTQNDQYEIITADNGQQALDKLEAHKPDVMLLDIMMPVMDGYDVCRNVRKNPTFSEMPIIMLTALGDKADVLKGFEAGADDYISKPFDFNVLQVRVKALSRRALSNRGF